MTAAKVYAVEWGNEFPAEIDSLWTTEEEAKKRADELGGAKSTPERHGIPSEGARHEYVSEYDDGGLVPIPTSNLLSRLSKSERLR